MTDVRAFDMLVVCTGNICRSPAAERLFAHELKPALGAAVSSAGTEAVVGSAIAPAMAELLRKGRIDTDRFASRQLTPSLLADASLVLTMTKAHRATAAATHPQGVRRMFTLREFAAILSLPGASAAISHVGVEARAALSLEWAREHRTTLAATFPGFETDIADPHGRGAGAYERAMNEITAAVRTITSVLNVSGR